MLLNDGHGGFIASNLGTAPDRTYSAALADIDGDGTLDLYVCNYRSDDIHDRGLKKLYQKAKDGDPMDFVRGNAIYGHLEESVDRFDDVANEIQGIVIEHA